MRKKPVIVMVIVVVIFIIVCLSQDFIDRNANGNREVDFIRKTKGIVEESEEKKIDKEKLDYLEKDKLDSLIVKESSNKSKQDKQLDLNKPNIDWSSGELGEQQLATMTTVVCKLYEEKLNKKQENRYKVSAVLPTNEEIVKFRPAIFYYVEGEILTLNLKVTVYDLQKKTQKDILTTLSVKYDLDVVKLEG